MGKHTNLSAQPSDALPKVESAPARYLGGRRVPSQSEKDSLKARLKYDQQKDREIVRGIFRFHECPGGLLSFFFKKYAEDDVERYDLFDNQIHEIPLGVAKHLNKNCFYNSYSFVPSNAVLEPTVHNAAGSYIGHEMKITTKKRRCSFQSLEFIDIDDLTPVGVGLTDIVTVEANL